jgi:deoxyadenosine/deoxycytidine kinase
MEASELLVITGPIASGKSTIGFQVAEESDFTFFPEDVDTAPVDREILARYYDAVEIFGELKDRDDAHSVRRLEEAQRHVFETQIHFIRKRSEILKRIVAEGAKAVVERHPWDDLHIFSRRNVNYGLLTRDQFESIYRLAEAEILGIPIPRVMVFLSAEPRNLRARIRKRGRIQEKELLSPDNPYLEEIAELYDDWYTIYHGDKFRIRTDGLDEAEVVARIAARLREMGVALVRQRI